MTNKWHMTDNEIRRSWRCAVNHQEQIAILAQLNCRTKTEVIQKLGDLGLMSETLQADEEKLTKKKKRKPFSAAEIRKIFSMYVDGITIKDIAAVIDAKPETVKTTMATLRNERRKAWPVIDKAIKAYMLTPECTESDRKVLRREIARGCE